MWRFRSALRSGVPADFLGAVGQIVTITDPRTADPFRREPPQVTLEELVDTFLGTDITETTAALHVIQALSADDLLAARIGKVQATRRQPMPAWLLGLGDVIVTTVLELTEELKDGDDYLLGARFPTGEELTALVYVDHNLGTVVKDAFVIGEPIETVVAKMSEIIDADQSLAPFDPATARAILTEAIDHGAMLFPPPETETWPHCRPVVEWLVRQLPPGGAVPDVPEWSEDQQARLSAEFFASTYGRDLDHPDERSLLEDLIWFGTGWCGGDPLRWSAVNVEILLADWIPRKIVADVEFLTKAPHLLRAFVRFCHDRRGIKPHRTAEVLAAIDDWEPEFQRLIRTERLQGADALAAMMLDAQREAVDYDDVSVGEIMLEALDRSVGGRTSLMRLDVSPLPDEEFAWAGIPEDIHLRVTEVLELCDRAADDLFDVEHRTAMRRFLGRAAVADPGIFRRKGKPERAAAAVAWVIGRANHSVGPYPSPIEVQHLLSTFGVSGSVSQRAEVFLRANGVDPRHLYGSMDLGTPDLLVSSQRRQIVELRDHWLAEA